MQILSPFQVKRVDDNSDRLGEFDSSVKEIAFSRIFLDLPETEMKEYD